MRLSTELLNVEPAGHIEFASGIGTGEPGGIHAGTYSDPVLSDAPGQTFAEIWAKLTGAGHGYVLRLHLQAANATPNTHNALRAELDLTAGSGLPGGGAAGHFASDLYAGATGISGLFAGLNAAMIIGADARALTGKFASLVLQSEIGAGNTFGQEGSFMCLIDSSDVKYPTFLDFELLTAGASKAYDTSNTDESNCVGFLRVIVPGGTIRGIPVCVIQ